MPLQIVDADAASAIFDDDSAAVSTDGGRTARHELYLFLVVSRIRRVVAINENERLAAVRTLINDIATVRTDGRRAVGESIAGRSDRRRRIRLAVVEVDGAIGIVGHESSVGADDRAKMIPGARRDLGDRGQRHDERRRYGYGRYMQ